MMKKKKKESVRYQARDDTLFDGYRYRERCIVVVTSKELIDFFNVPLANSSISSRLQDP